MITIELPGSTVVQRKVMETPFTGSTPGFIVADKLLGSISCWGSTEADNGTAIRIAKIARMIGSASQRARDEDVARIQGKMLLPEAIMRDLLLLLHVLSGAAFEGRSAGLLHHRRSIGVDCSIAGGRHL
jgi:hypothetical protein